MRKEGIYVMLWFIKGIRGMFYHYEINWVYPPPADQWWQVPGQQRIPRRFRTLCMRLETVDIAAYRRRLPGRYGPDGFKQARIRDLEARRDKYRMGRKPDANTVCAISLG